MILTSNIVPLNNLAAVEDLHSDLILYIEFFIFMIFVCFFFPLMSFKFIVWIVFLISLNCLPFVSWISFSFLTSILLNSLSEQLLESYFNCIALDTSDYFFPHFLWLYIILKFAHLKISGLLCFQMVTLRVTSFLLKKCFGWHSCPQKSYSGLRPWCVQ